MSQLTKKAIVEAFIKLLNERPLDKIKVKDIVEECGINRNTFYYHFQDIPAMIEEIMRDEVDRVLAEQKQAETWEEGFIQGAEFAIKNKKALYHIYKSVSRDVVERYLNTIAEDVMTRFVEYMAGDLSPLEEDKLLVIHFYKAALVGMILDWMEAGMKYDTEKLIRRIGYLFEGNIYASLEKSSNSRTGQTK